MHDTGTGLLLLILAALMNASFSLPVKLTRRWKWENTWFVWSVFALILLPRLVTVLTVPDLRGIYHQAGSGIVLVVGLFGFAWGIAQVLFGVALEVIGIALTFSTVLGLSAAMGGLIPLVSQHRDQVFTPAGLTTLAGIALVVAGVSICAVAGRMRERAQPRGEASGMPFAQGLAIAAASGVCASMMNFGVAFGKPLITAAAQAGAQPYWTVNTVWVPLLLGGAFPNIAYCLYLMRKNRTADNFRLPGTGSYWGLALVMAAFWFGSSLLYGAASIKLGDLGAVLGWPLFMSLIVIVASLLGVATGEWKSTGNGPLRIQLSGVLVLVAAVVVLSRASQ